MSAPGLKGIIVVLAVGGIGAVQAQNSFAPPPEPEWQQLSPETRDRMRRQYLEKLPPDERKKLRSQVKRFNSMSPSKQQELCRRFQKDRGYLPPACQKLF
jgi:hypothetical protein